MKSIFILFIIALILTLSFASPINKKNQKKNEMKGQREGRYYPGYGGLGGLGYGGLGGLGYGGLGGLGYGGLGGLGGISNSNSFASASSGSNGFIGG